MSRRSSSTSGTTSKPPTAADSVTSRVVRRRSSSGRTTSTSPTKRPIPWSRFPRRRTRRWSEGRRRPQLLARQQRGLRRHPHDLDLELGGRHRQRRQRRRARAAGAARPGASKSFPADAALYQSTVYPIVEQYCQRCHSPSAATAQSPYFASEDITEAYGAAKTKINLDQPALSRLVVRLRSEFHNCWSDCAANANTMQAAIQAFANQIPLTAGRRLACAVEGAQSL